MLLRYWVSICLVHLIHTTQLTIVCCLLQTLKAAGDVLAIEATPASNVDGTEPWRGSSRTSQGKGKRKLGVNLASGCRSQHSSWSHIQWLLQGVDCRVIDFQHMSRRGAQIIILIFYYRFHCIAFPSSPQTKEFETPPIIYWKSVFHFDIIILHFILSPNIYCVPTKMEGWVLATKRKGLLLFFSKWPHLLCSSYLMIWRQLHLSVLFHMIIGKLMDYVGISRPPSPCLTLLFILSNWPMKSRTVMKRMWNLGND